MKARICLKCKKHNYPNAWNCVRCGKTLSLKSVVETDSSTVDDQDAKVIQKNRIAVDVMVFIFFDFFFICLGGILFGSKSSGVLIFWITASLLFAFVYDRYLKQ